MASDFWAGYVSGALGIIIGNPLDVVKVRLQAGDTARASASQLNSFEKFSSLVRGAAAPILGYGALNAILFVAYNRSLKALDPSIDDPTNLAAVPLYKVWAAGAAGGLASWTISSPTELIKCRAQLDVRAEVSSWSVAKDIYRHRGWRGLYYGGGITSARDAIGYGFYCFLLISTVVYFANTWPLSSFWSYELCKALMTTEDETSQQTALKVLLSGGIAGVITWGSVFPLDMIKTRLQAQTIHDNSSTAYIEGHQPLLRPERPVLSSFQIAKETWQVEGVKPFYRGLGVCSIRAFLVNAVQWAAYEWLMEKFNDP